MVVEKGLSHAFFWSRWAVSGIAVEVESKTCVWPKWLLRGVIGCSARTADGKADEGCRDWSGADQ